jgi:hypothetical protein
LPLEHRLALLGADHLFWESYSEHGKYKSFLNYHSSRIVLLSVEPGGTQSRRKPVFRGNLPPRFADFPDIKVYVNGEELPKRPALRGVGTNAAASNHRSSVC